MHFLSLFPFALTVSAFLVPAEVKPIQISKLPLSSKWDRVALECNNCPVFVESAWNSNKWIPMKDGYDSKLNADIAVQGKRVLFNGQQVFPPSNGLPLSVTQTMEKKIWDVKSLGTYKQSLPISSSIEFKPTEYLSDGKVQFFIHPVYIEILAIQDKVVHTESVEIRVADIDGEISLLPSRIRAYEPSSYTDACTTVWCRVRGTITKKYNEWRAAATKKISSWKGCGTTKSQFHPIPIKGGPKKYGGTLRPGHHAHPHHHHHHHDRSRFFNYIFETILLPVLYGLAAGVLIFVGSWMINSGINRARNARQGEYVAVEQIEIEEGRIDLPPKYEEATEKEKLPQYDPPSGL